MRAVKSLSLNNYSAATLTGFRHRKFDAGFLAMGCGTEQELEATPLLGEYQQSNVNSPYRLYAYALPMIAFSASVGNLEVLLRLCVGE